MAKIETAKTAVLSLHAVPSLGEAPEFEGPLPKGVSTLAEQPLVPPLLKYAMAAKQPMKQMSRKMAR